MGLFASELKKAKSENEGKFKPLELNEANVQAIFNRCLATKNTKELARATLFPPTRGYKEGTEKLIYFDKEALLKNKKALNTYLGKYKKSMFCKKKSVLI